METYGLNRCPYAIWDNNPPSKIGKQKQYPYGAYKCCLTGSYMCDQYGSVNNTAGTSTGGTWPCGERNYDTCYLIAKRNKEFEKNWKHVLKHKMRFRKEEKNSAEERCPYAIWEATPSSKWGKQYATCYKNAIKCSLTGEYMCDDMGYVRDAEGRCYQKAPCEGYQRIRDCALLREMCQKD